MASWPPVRGAALGDRADLQGGDATVHYTDQFSGTSSASPIVTGAVALVSSVAQQKGGSGKTTIAINLAVAAAGSMVIVNTVVLVKAGFGLAEPQVALALTAFGAGFTWGAGVIGFGYGRAIEHEKSSLQPCLRTS